MADFICYSCGEGIHGGVSQTRCVDCLMGIEEEHCEFCATVLGADDVDFCAACQESLDNSESASNYGDTYGCDEDFLRGPFV